MCDYVYICYMTFCRCCFLMGQSLSSTLRAAMTCFLAWARQVWYACCSKPNTGASGHKYNRLDCDIESGSINSAGSSPNELQSTILQEQLETLRREKSDLQWRFEQTEKENKRLQQVIEQENKRLQQIEQENKRLQQIEQENKRSSETLRHGLEEANKEKRDLLNRLSEIAGAKLTDKNPNVTDLSDQDRATKLAERYSELYDNEWTNAFTDLTETRKHPLSEEDAIVGLLDVLRIVNTGCFAFSTETWLELTDALSARTGQTVSAEEFPTVYKSLKDIRKAMAPNMMKKLLQYIGHSLEKDAKNNRRLSAAMENTEYIEACVSLCWKMTIQDPPLFISFNSKHGEHLNKDIYRPYTRDGKVVEYLVWPTLYLHEDGPILAKGVAQGESTTVQNLIDI